MILELVASHDSVGSVSAYTLLVNWHALQRLLTVEVPAWLGWWMPVNYVAFLAFSLWLSDAQHRLRPFVRTLWWHLAMTVGFLPMLGAVIAYATLATLCALRGVRREHKRRRAALTAGQSDCCTKEAQ